MAWLELRKTWHDTNVDYCDVCGNLLIRRDWVFEAPDGPHAASLPRERRAAARAAARSSVPRSRTPEAQYDASQKKGARS